jgi:hypothetical protein
MGINLTTAAAIGMIVGGVAYPLTGRDRGD